MNIWGAGESYEPYVGRWSRVVAAEFVEWVAPEPGSRCLDIGCGTGALSGVLVEQARPSLLAGLDPSEAYIRFARKKPLLASAALTRASAVSLPFRNDSFDVIVSGLVLNFVPDPASAADEMARVLRPNGRVAAYVWDYAEGMQFMRYFWDVACELDKAALELDEGRRFPVCRPDGLAALFSPRFENVEVRALEVPTVFRDFEDYWQPFLGGQGPAPGYLASLPEGRRVALRETLRQRLPTSPDGSIPLSARAWAVRAEPMP